MVIELIQSGDNINTSEDLDIQALLESIYFHYGHDFRDYSRASIKRRVFNVLSRSDCKSVPELQDKLLKDPAFYSQFISDLTVNVTEMFRDPSFYRAIRQELIPVLRTYPSIRIWHAGCSTGEEVYSMAILLKEEGVYDRSFLYGTDISPRAIEKAKEGIYPANLIQSFTANYQKAGGVESFSNYYTAKYDNVKIDASLRKNILFAQHNLATDDVFSEFHVIFCRNVLIYFSKQLQDRALALFHRSLIRRGYLCLGTKETTEFSKLETSFETVLKDERIYRKL